MPRTFVTGVVISTGDDWCMETQPLRNPQVGQGRNIATRTRRCFAPSPFLLSGHLRLGSTVQGSQCISAVIFHNENYHVETMGHYGLDAGWCSMCGGFVFLHDVAPVLSMAIKGNYWTRFSTLCLTRDQQHRGDRAR